MSVWSQEMLDRSFQDTLDVEAAGDDVVTGTTGHLGRLTMERLLIRAIACSQYVVHAGPNRGRCLKECSII